MGTGRCTQVGLGCLRRMLSVNLYLLTRPDLTDPALDIVGFRRRVCGPLVSHLDKDAIGRRLEPAPGP